MNKVLNNTNTTNLTAGKFGSAADFVLTHTLTAYTCARNITFTQQFSNTHLLIFSYNIDGYFSCCNGCCFAVETQNIASCFAFTETQNIASLRTHNNPQSYY